MKAYGQKPIGDITICRLYQGLRFHSQREDGTNPTSIPKETVAAITILYRNTKVKVRSLDGDTEYFDIVAGVPQADTVAPYLFIICLDYVLRTSIDKIRENGFELTKKRSRRYPAKTITDADYADDIALLANAPNQAETLLHSLERAAACIGLHVNAHKTEYMCYNQTGDISTLYGTSLKLVDKFIYLGSSVSSTEKDIYTWLTKAWIAIDRLSIIWKSDLTDKIYRDYYIPRKARFIPTFCKRTNRTQPAVEIWVRVFEERKTNYLYVQQNLYTTTTTIINRVLHQMAYQLFMVI